MDLLINLLCFLGALVAMEGVAYFAHKYVMHGFGWVLHESHHRPREGLFELNDLYALIFAIPSIILIWFGTNGYPAALWAGLGVAGYGVIYFGFHDVIVHRRIHHDWRPLKRCCLDTPCLKPLSLQRPTENTTPCGKICLKGLCDTAIIDLNGRVMNSKNGLVPLPNNIIIR